jgi:hypothetical protein
MGVAINSVTNFKEILYVIIVLMIVVAIIYFMGKYAGKATPPEVVRLPNDTNPGLTFNAGPYTDAIHKDIYAGIFTGRTVKPYNDVLLLSDSQLVAIYNDWNKRYFKDDNENLIQAMRSERSSFWSISWYDVREELINRLNKLVSQGSIQ